MADLINTLFSGYYSLLVAAIVILMPVWFGSFLAQAAGVLLRHRTRD